MRFVITEKRDNDRYVIYDMENKGSACVSKYTIKQLIEGESTIIIGVTYSYKNMGSNEVVIENITPYTKDGSRPASKIISNSYIPDTKRSFATVIKGLKPSRAEIKALNDKTKKTKATKKANKKAKKVAEDTALKEKKKAEAELKAEKEKYKVIKKRVQKSKPQLYLKKIKIMATEYDEKLSYEFRVECHTPAAVTKLNNFIKSTTAYADTRNAGDTIKRRGYFSTRLDCEGSYVLDDPDIQLFAEKEVWLDFDGSWERCEIRFSSYNDYRPEFTYTHGSAFSDDTHFGADAYADHTANGEARWLRKVLGRPL